MTPERARAILAEAARRKTPSPLRQACFPKQRAFLDDPARFKAALCTRRAGKSYGIGAWLCDAADRFPGTAQLYLGLTIDTVRRIMWNPVLKVQNATFGLGASFNEKPMEMRFPNGSVIYLLGIDADENERKKVLGQKYKRVAVDECGSMTYDLDALVTRYIRPTLVDLRGELLLAGTPENHRNYFYDVTGGEKQGEFAVHRWSAFDNPHVAESWAEEIAELKRLRPGIEETPLFQQHYLGLWTVDTSALVYSYSRARNWLPMLPRPVEEGHVVVSVDLGYNDATAVVVSVYFDHDPTLYIIEAHKRERLTVSDVAAWLRGFMDRYAIERFVIDPASKQVVEELRQRYHLPLESAEKSGKVEAIAMMNSDLLTARIRVVGDACAALTDEWAGLVWDARALEQGKRQEHSACENHCSDGALYGWRAALHYAAVPVEKKPARGTEEEADAFWDGEEDRQRKARKVPFWERD